MKRDLFLIGGGGHCISVIDAIEKSGNFNIKGILDQPEKVGGQVLGYPIIGTDKELAILKGPDRYFLITLGQINTSEIRRQIFTNGQILNLKWATVVSPLSYVSRHAEVGEGSVVLHGAIVNAGARVGKNCIVNSLSLVEHEAIVGDHCHIATGAIVNGQCQVGAESFIGSQSVLRQNLTIPDKSFIQAGSFVNKLEEIR